MAERHILLFSRPSCRAFVSLPAAGTVESLLCCPAAGTVGLSAQLAYKSSCPFRKHRNSRPQICVSGPFHLRKLVVAPGNRNWSRGGRDIDPRPRRFEQGGAVTISADLQKGACPIVFSPATGLRGSCFLARGRDCRELALLPRGRAVGLSAQLAYKSSCLF